MILSMRPLITDGMLSLNLHVLHLKKSLTVNMNVTEVTEKALIRGQVALNGCESIIQSMI